MDSGTIIREDRLRTVVYQPAAPVRCAAVLMSMGHLPRRSRQHCGLPTCCTHLARRRSDVQSPVGARTAAFHAQQRIQPITPAQGRLSCTSSAGCTPPWVLTRCWPEKKQTNCDANTLACQIYCCPHRLVVRTSRCGRDNPGSNPGVDTLVGWQCCLALPAAACCVSAGSGPVSTPCLPCLA